MNSKQGSSMDKSLQTRASGQLGQKPASSRAERQSRIAGRYADMTTVELHKEFGIDLGPWFPKEHTKQTKAIHDVGVKLVTGFAFDPNVSSRVRMQRKRQLAWAMAQQDPSLKQELKNLGFEFSTETDELVYKGENSPNIFEGVARPAKLLEPPATPGAATPQPSKKANRPPTPHVKKLGNGSFGAPDDSDDDDDDESSPAPATPTPKTFTPKTTTNGASSDTKGKRKADVQITKDMHEAEESGRGAKSDSPASMTSSIFKSIVGNTASDEQMRNRKIISPSKLRSPTKEKSNPFANTPRAEPTSPTKSSSNNIFGSLGSKSATTTPTNASSANVFGGLSVPGTAPAAMFKPGGSGSSFNFSPKSPVTSFTAGPEQVLHPKFGTPSKGAESSGSSSTTPGGSIFQSATPSKSTSNIFAPKLGASTESSGSDTPAGSPSKSASNIFASKLTASSDSPSTPSKSSTTPSSTPFKMPSFVGAVSPADFLAANAAKTKEAEKKAEDKMMEDTKDKEWDEDEITEKEWEAQWKAKRAEERKKIREDAAAAKPTGFTPKPVEKSAEKSPEKSAAEPAKEAAESAPATQPESDAAPKSLFERISKPDTTSQPATPMFGGASTAGPTSSTPSTSIFGQAAGSSTPAAASTPSIFGGNNTSSTTKFLFGQASKPADAAPASTASNTSSIFATAKAPTTTAPAAGSVLFGKSGASTSTDSGTTSIFSKGVTPTTAAPAGSGLFSKSGPSTSTDSGKPSIFAKASTPATTAPPAGNGLFGSTSTAPSSSGTSFSINDVNANIRPPIGADFSFTNPPVNTSQAATPATSGLFGNSAAATSTAPPSSTLYEPNPMSHSSAPYSEESSAPPSSAPDMESSSVAPCTGGDYSSFTVTNDADANSTPPVPSNFNFTNPSASSTPSTGFSFGNSSAPSTSAATSAPTSFSFGSGSGAQSSGQSNQMQTDGSNGSSSQPVIFGSSSGQNQTSGAPSFNFSASTPAFGGSNTGSSNPFSFSVGPGQTGGSVSAPSSFTFGSGDGASTGQTQTSTGSTSFTFGQGNNSSGSIFGSNAGQNNGGLSSSMFASQGTTSTPGNSKKRSGDGDIDDGGRYNNNSNWLSTPDKQHPGAKWTTDTRHNLAPPGSRPIAKPKGRLGKRPGGGTPGAVSNTFSGANNGSAFGMNSSVQSNTGNNPFGQSAPGNGFGQSAPSGEFNFNFQPFGQSGQGVQFGAGGGFGQPDQSVQSGNGGGFGQGGQGVQFGQPAPSGSFNSGNTGFSQTSQTSQSFGNPSNTSSNAGEQDFLEEDYIDLDLEDYDADHKYYSSEEEETDDGDLMQMDTTTEETNKNASARQSNDGNSNASGQTSNDGTPTTPTTMTSNGTNMFGKRPTDDTEMGGQSPPKRQAGANGSTPSFNFSGNGESGQAGATGPTPSFNFSGNGGSGQTSTNSSFSFSGNGGNGQGGANGSQPSFNLSQSPSQSPSQAPSQPQSQALAEADGGEPSDEPNQPQIDRSQMADGEEDENRLFEIRAKALKWEPVLDPHDKAKPSTTKWNARGTGVLRILQHKKTGTCRFLLRADMTGKIVFNKAFIDNTSYEAHAKTVKVAALPDDGTGGKLEAWILQVKTEEAAKELAQHANWAQEEADTGRSPEAFEHA